MRRRTYLVTGGAIAMSCLGGCLGGDGDPDDGQSDDGESDDGGADDAGSDDAGSDDGGSSNGGTGDDGEATDGEPGDPEERIEEFVAAIDEGSQDRVNGMLARQGEADPWTLGERARMEAFDLEVTSIERLEESADRIVVAVTIRISGQGGFTETETTEYELRAIDGEWKVWNITVRDSSS